MNQRCTLHVELSECESLKLAVALEMYPNAVGIDTEHNLRYYHYRDVDYAIDADVLEDLEYNGYVTVGYRDAGLHLEQAPNEWTHLECDYTYPILMRAHNHLSHLDALASQP